MTLTAPATPASQPAAITLRPSVAKLTTDELATFRSAMSKALAIPDERGYQYFANWHGVTLGLCQHHNDLFLPWHRAYLYYFELALRAQEPSVALPWWDWTTSADIPAAYQENSAPGEQPNVLAAAPIQPWGPATGAPAQTDRQVGASGVTGPPYDTTYAMAATSFNDFEQRLWAIHDQLHVWVGGTMSDPAWAAYDPLFWAHHCMVDRLWRIWQHNTPGAAPPANLRATALEPKGMTVAQTLDVTQLGYDYAGTVASVPGTTG